MAADQKKKKKQKQKNEIEQTPEERFAQLQTLKRATRCMLVEQDVYDVYVKLAKDFAQLGKTGEEEPFEGCEECAGLSEECARLAEEWKKTHQTERVEESRTVTTSVREREAVHEKGKGKWIALAVLVLLIAAIASFQIDAVKYQAARLVEAAGFEGWAEDSYEKLGEYKDSPDRMLQLQKETIRQTKKGRSVAFGKDVSVDAKGKTTYKDCKWIVLDKRGDDVLLIKQDCIRDKPYHDSQESVTWETCTLRKELNSTFIDRTFTSGEKDMIRTTRVPCHENETYKTDGGAATSDKLFIMDETETQQYCRRLGDKLELMRLRTPGKDKDTTTYVSACGRTGNKKKTVDIIDYGFPADHCGVCIHPCMWVDCGQG